MLAMLAVETGIPASVLAEEDWLVVKAMLDYLKKRVQQQRRKR